MSASTPDLSHREITTVLLGLMAGMFLAALDQTIVAAAIRVIADDLGDLQGQAWATTAYLMTATISTPLYGKISDIYGRKPLFTAAITIFLIGSALCTIAGSMTTLAAYRAVQGLGAGGLFSLALAILGDIVPPRERARCQGYFLAVFGTSSVIGSVVGGFFAGADQIAGVTGWRWVFLINVPIGLIALVVVQRSLTIKHTRLDHRLDFGGALALITALVPLLLVAESGREWGWLSPAACACYAIVVLAGVAFMLVERHMGPEALIPPTLWRHKTIAVGSAGGMLIGMGMFGGMAIIPLYLQLVRGASPTLAGLQMIPMTLGIMTTSLASGQIIARTGRYKMLPVTGAAIMAAALFALHYLASNTPLSLVMVGMFIFGAGLGLCMQPLVLAMQQAVPREQIGVATSTSTFTRQIGGTIGTALSLSVLFSRVPSDVGEQLNAATASPQYADALASARGSAGADAQFAQQLADESLLGSLLNDSSLLNRVSPELAQPVFTGFSHAMDTVFLLGSIIMCAAFALLWALPSVQLADTRRPSE